MWLRDVWRRLRGKIAPDNDDDDDIDLDDEELSDVDRLRNKDIPGVVLFADIDPNDPDAVAARVAEYEQLFGGS